MLKNICLVILGLLVAIFIGSLFVWAIGAFVLAVVFALAQQWGFVCLFALASFCWFGAGVFFVRLPRQEPDAEESTAEAQSKGITVLHRRVATAFGVVMGTGFGLAAGVILEILAIVFSSSIFLPVAIMFAVICACTLLCYALPNVGPEILSQLEVAVDVT